MGAHVWGPAYLRDHLLPQFRLTGWANDWYAGFPIYIFYMLPPALLVVLFDVLLPYGEALKIVSALGILTLPICCWAFGKLSGMRFPLPPLLAVASVIFLFDETFQIYGGNIASTMAGEYSFSIALSLAMLFFGVFAYALRTGKHRALAAVLFALACLSHGIVIFFVIVGALVLFGLHLLQSIHGPIRAGAIVKVALTTTVVGGLLSAFWVIPFVLLHRFGTDMFYERNSNYAGHAVPPARRLRLAPHGGRRHRVARCRAAALAQRALPRHHDGAVRRLGRGDAPEPAVEQPAAAVHVPDALHARRRRHRRDRPGHRQAHQPREPLARLEPAPRHARRGVARRVARPRSPLPGAALRWLHQRGWPAGVRLAPGRSDPEERDRRLREVLGQVELRGLRGQGRLRRVQRHRQHHEGARRGPGLRPGASGRTTTTRTSTARPWR